jgi:hypothetical protein
MELGAKGRRGKHLLDRGRQAPWKRGGGGAPCLGLRAGTARFVVCLFVLFVRGAGEQQCPEEKSCLRPEGLFGMVLVP